MMRWLKRLFCRHGAISIVRNLYGDQINDWNGMRSLWRCKRCGATVPMEYLNEPPPSEPIPWARG